MAHNLLLSQVLGVVSVLLQDMPSTPQTAWYPIQALRTSDKATGAVKLCLCAHVIPKIMVERPRRDFAQLKENGSRGLGTVEVTVVACKSLAASDETGTREAMVSVQVGQSKQMTERIPASLNPVFNKPMIFKVDPGVKTMKIAIFDKAGKGGSEFGVTTVDLEEMKEDEEVDDWWILTSPDRKSKNSMGEVRILPIKKKVLPPQDRASRLRSQPTPSAAAIVIAALEHPSRHPLQSQRVS